MVYCCENIFNPNASDGKTSIGGDAISSSASSVGGNGGTMGGGTAFQGGNGRKCKCKLEESLDGI